MEADGLYHPGHRPSKWPERRTALRDEEGVDQRFGGHISHTLSLSTSHRRSGGTVPPQTSGQLARPPRDTTGGREEVPYNAGLDAATRSLVHSQHDRNPLRKVTTANVLADRSAEVRGDK